MPGNDGTREKNSALRVDNRCAGIDTAISSRDAIGEADGVINAGDRQRRYNPSMQIERNEIRCFHAVVEAGGFSRAAERLDLSQSAVSQAIANLEHRLGAVLLRRGNPPQLTEAGIRMLLAELDQPRPKPQEGDLALPAPVASTGLSEGLSRLLAQP